MRMKIKAFLITLAILGCLAGMSLVPYCLMTIAIVLPFILFVWFVWYAVYIALQEYTGKERLGSTRAHMRGE